MNCNFDVNPDIINHENRPFIYFRVYIFFRDNMKNHDLLNSQHTTEINECMNESDECWVNNFIHRLWCVDPFSKRIHSWWMTGDWNFQGKINLWNNEFHTQNALHLKFLREKNGQTIGTEWNGIAQTEIIQSETHKRQQMCIIYFIHLFRPQTFTI